MELKFKEYENHDEYGTWGEWTYDDEHGTFGKNQKGMWAQKNGDTSIGVQTYEQRPTMKFYFKVVEWRRLNFLFKKYCQKVQWKAD